MNSIPFYFWADYSVLWWKKFDFFFLPQLRFSNSTIIACSPPHSQSLPSKLSILKVICLFAVQPVCGADQKMVYGVAHGEIASINCTVKANPTAGIRFRWTFNSSAELNTLPQSRYTVSGPTSQVCTYYFSVKSISRKFSWKYFHGKNKKNEYRVSWKWWTHLQPSVNKIGEN